MSTQLVLDIIFQTRCKMIERGIMNCYNFCHQLHHHHITEKEIGVAATSRARREIKIRRCLSFVRTHSIGVALRASVRLKKQKTHERHILSARIPKLSSYVTGSSSKAHTLLIINIIATFYPHIDD